MAAIIPTIGVVVTGLSTLMAHRNDVVGNTFAETFVKDEVLANELVLKAQLTDLARVVDDPSMQLEHIIKAAVPHPGTGLFTTNTAGTIHQQVLILVLPHQVFDDLKFLPECIDIRTNCALEVAYFAFIVVAHIHDDCVRILRQPVEFNRVYVNTRIRDVERIVVQSIGDNLFTDQDLEFEKGLPVVINPQIEM